MTRDEAKKVASSLIADLKSGKLKQVGLDEVTAALRRDRAYYVTIKDVGVVCRMVVEASAKL